MQSASVPRPRDDKTARAHLRASVQAAADAGLDPGHWHLHHIALLGGPGDFTPYRHPEYAEEHLSPAGSLLEALSGVFGIDHAAGISARGRELEAG